MNCPVPRKYVARWYCTECNWYGTIGEFLSAPNPFDENDSIIGCPNCKQVECIEAACDEPGCKKSASCGTPSGDGYRVTCGNHKPTERNNING